MPLWDASRDYIRVVLRDMQIEARVGMHPWERHPEKPSRLVVNIELFSTQTGPETFIDYDKIHDGLRTWPSRPHVALLETLVEEIVTLCFAIVGVEACRVSIMKPDIFNDAAGVGIEIYRRRPTAA